MLSQISWSLMSFQILCAHRYHDNLDSIILHISWSLTVKMINLWSHDLLHLMKSWISWYLGSHDLFILIYDLSDLIISQILWLLMISWWSFRLLNLSDQIIFIIYIYMSLFHDFLAFQLALVIKDKILSKKSLTRS